MGLASCPVENFSPENELKLIMEFRQNCTKCTTACNLETKCQHFLGKRKGNHLSKVPKPKIPGSDIHNSNMEVQSSHVQSSHVNETFSKAAVYHAVV